MEDMARLAMVEQSVRDEDKFNKILYELLRRITHILENPHDYDLRTLKSDLLKDVSKFDTFKDYLKYIGFKLQGSDFVYPKELTLSNLRMAQAAIERKISFCYGIKIANLNLKSSHNLMKKMELRPAKILVTKNPLLLKIEDLFNSVLDYEDEELQALARDQIPLVTLQLMALDRVRDQQKKIKTGETKDPDLPFDVALLMELLGWFKYNFFSWVDKPPCEVCAGPTVLTKKVNTTCEKENCMMEVYSCMACGAGAGGARFPRFNRVKTLLRTRRGRCGEWANCFALLCRALGYDTRYVYDTTDHVWCEVFDYDSKTWLHADPCEAKLNAPLMYEHGWGKKLSYVIAVSRDDVQDVTWRYSLNHKQTMSRRTACAEHELLQALLTLRDHRQRHLSDARRHYLAHRAVTELVHLMQEKKPTDYESHGRISGSKQWRSDRGEIGQGNTFEFALPGPCSVRYNAGLDKYSITEAGKEISSLSGWATGVYHAENIFRKVENDWEKVYLARQEDESLGSVSWRFATSSKLCLTEMQIRINTAVYETGSIQWTVQYDQDDPQPLKFDEINGTAVATLRRAWGSCSSVVVAAVLRGGSGDVAWQHAQLCRAALNERAPSLTFRATAAPR